LCAGKELPPVLRLFLAVAVAASVAPFVAAFASPLFVSALAKPARQSSARPSFHPNYARGAEMTALLRWPKLPVRVWFDTASVAYTDERKGRVCDGFDLWTKGTGGVIRYTVVDKMEQAQMIIRFLPGASIEGDPHSIGRTGTRFRDGNLKSGFMEIATQGAEPQELTETAAHEWGHALGLNGHSENPNDLMYPNAVRYIAGPGVILPIRPRRVPSARDINTIKTAYADLFVKQATSAAR
jgi:hypothetical protein